MSSHDYLYSGSSYFDVRIRERVCLCTICCKTLPLSQEHQTGVLVCQNTISLFKAVPKGPKIKHQNQKVKSWWLNSRSAVNFTNSTQSILVSKSTSSSKKSKIQKENPLHSGNGSRRFRSIQQHCYNSLYKLSNPS